MSLFVKNLSYHTDEEDLKSIFADFGVKRTTVLRNNEGKSKGIAFVDVENEAGAIEDLNGALVAGREIVVEVARPRTETNNRANKSGFQEIIMGHIKAIVSHCEDRHTKMKDKDPCTTCYIRNTCLEEFQRKPAEWNTDVPAGN